MFILILFFLRRIAWRWPWSLEGISVVICFARPPRNAQPRLPRQYPGVEYAVSMPYLPSTKAWKRYSMAIPVPIHFLHFYSVYWQSQFQTSETFVLLGKKHHHGCDIGRAPRPPESPVVSPSWTQRARTERENGSGGIAQGMTSDQTQKKIK